jgi:hypothetical protein
LRFEEDESIFGFGKGDTLIDLFFSGVEIIGCAAPP